MNGTWAVRLGTLAVGVTLALATTAVPASAAARWPARPVPRSGTSPGRSPRRRLRRSLHPARCAAPRSTPPRAPWCSPTARPSPPCSTATRCAAGGPSRVRRSPARPTGPGGSPPAWTRAASPPRRELRSRPPPRCRTRPSAWRRSRTARRRRSTRPCRRWASSASRRRSSSWRSSPTAPRSGTTPAALERALLRRHGQRARLLPGRQLGPARPHPGHGDLRHRERRGDRVGHPGDQPPELLQRHRQPGPGRHGPRHRGRRPVHRLRELRHERRRRHRAGRAAPHRHRRRLRGVLRGHDVVLRRGCGGTGGRSTAVLPSSTARPWAAAATPSSGSRTASRATRRRAPGDDRHHGPRVRPRPGLARPLRHRRSLRGGRRVEPDGLGQLGHEVGQQHGRATPRCCRMRGAVRCRAGSPRSRSPRRRTVSLPQVTTTDTVYRLLPDPNGPQTWAYRGRRVLPRREPPEGRPRHRPAGMWPRGLPRARGPDQQRERHRPARRRRRGRRSGGPEHPELPRGPGRRVARRQRPRGAHLLDRAEHPAATTAPPRRRG